MLVVTSDWFAQRIIAPALGPLPVGIVTGGLGGAYLIWLLFYEWRRGGA